MLEIRGLKGGGHLEHVTVKRCHSREEKSNDLTKTKFVKLYGTGWHVQKEQDQKSPLAQNVPVGANWGRDISTIYSLE